MSQEIAKEILNQLGGNRFIAMTGSKKFGADKNSLSMKLRHNKSGANYLRITLNVMDTYDMEFISVRGASRIVKKKLEGIYNDQLQAMFTDVTGLYTSL